MIVARKDQHAQHLRILSGISSLLKDNDFRRGLIEVDDAETLYQRLTL
jgi:mannitol/fructose-specific phosphotransferase system IIA component (Ntr-type)